MKNSIYLFMLIIFGSKCIGQIDQKKYEEYAATIECPKEIYNGPDKTALKKKIETEFAASDWGKSNNLLKIYITGDSWNRKKEAVRTSSGAEWVDNSYLQVVLIIQPKDLTTPLGEEDIESLGGTGHPVGNPSSTIGYQLSYFLTKDHVNSDKIYYLNIRDNNFMEYPIAVKNLK